MAAITTSELSAFDTDLKSDIIWLGYGFFKKIQDGRQNFNPISESSESETFKFCPLWITAKFLRKPNHSQYNGICVEFLSHNIIRLQLVKIGILFMLSFLDD